jgi:hypothetical protein
VHEADKRLHPTPYVPPILTPQQMKVGLEKGIYIEDVCISREI